MPAILSQMYKMTSEWILRFVVGEIFEAERPQMLMAAISRLAATTIFRTHLFHTGVSVPSATNEE
jgi:hypothetical protein